MSLKRSDDCPKCGSGKFNIGPKWGVWAPAELQEVGLKECLQYWCDFCEYSIQVPCADAKPQKPRKVA